MRKLSLGRIAAVAAVTFGLTGLAAGPSAADTLQVPDDYATIQDAIDAASPGDQIRVGPGDWCGAIVDKTLDLFGEEGATIIGCPSPNVFDLIGALEFLRVGFIIDGPGASGTTIRHFLFDGEGVHNLPPDGDFDPLSLAIFGVQADNVIVEQNRILGTAQAISNSSGSGWTVSHNVIEGLTVFPCVGGVATCLGGIGIVFQERNVVGPRPTDNTAMFNDISGSVPDTLELFDTAVIWLLAQNGAVVQKNRIAMPDNPLADGRGVAIFVVDRCCGLPTEFLTSINSVIVKNDGRDSEIAVIIAKDAGGGDGNSEGLVLRGNFGVNIINDDTVDVTSRSIQTLEEF